MKVNRQPEAIGNPARTSLAGRTADLLASVKFAVAVILLIVAACIAGTVLPQGADAAAFVQRNPDAAARFALFDRLGFTHVFSARWFIALLCVLATTVMVCSTRRLATVKRASGSAQRRALGSMLTHLSILLILGGAVARGVWGEKGYLEMREGQTTAQFESEQGTRPLPFALQLARFEIETDVAGAVVAEAPKAAAPELIVQWTARQLEAGVPAIAGTTRTLTPEGETASPANTFRIEVLKYIPDFAVDMATHEVTSRSGEPNNPALLVAVNGPGYQNHRWVFANFPDLTMHEDGSPITASPLRILYRPPGVAAHPAAHGSVKNFKSTLALIDHGRPAGERMVSVNHPLKFKGYTFYQTGYNPNDLSWTSLEVVRDPGVPLVYAGFIFLISGLFIVFYFNPWITAREANA